LARQLAARRPRLGADRDAYRVASSLESDRHAACYPGASETTPRRARWRAERARRCGSVPRESRPTRSDGGRRVRRAWILHPFAAAAAPSPRSSGSTIMRKPLAEQVVVITGASTGIGRCAALHLARRGARVVLTSRWAEALDGLAGAIEAAG